LVNVAAQKNAKKAQLVSELGIADAESQPEQVVRNTAQLRPTGGLNETRGQDQTNLSDCTSACTACPAYQLSLCSEVREKVAGADWLPGTTPLASTAHTIPARRTICHHKEWSEFVPFICKGWAVSSITLADGRRQILSFLLPGDIVSAASLLEPMSGRTVEAITEVEYRKFKRSDLKAFLFRYPDMLETISRVWSDERAQFDQMALDLGRRTADERIARLILSLAERLAKRGLRNGDMMEFPLRQRHIADATGLTPVHVSKVLGEFQRAGMFEIGGRTLTINDEMELRRAAEWR
jgi:CRP/FNR family transcriptional regulator, anaerobic regulatory protein